MGGPGDASGLLRRTKEQMTEDGRKGAKKSHEKQRFNRTLREATEWALSLPAFKGNPLVTDLLKKYPALTNRDAMAISLTAQAVRKGDVKAFLALRDTAGEAPAQTVNLNNSPMVIRVETLDD